MRGGGKQWEGRREVRGGRERGRNEGGMREERR